MKLSIVTPVLNDPRVGLALDSILSQQLDAELELIVIDGGSTDGTLSLLEEYRDHLSVLVSEPDEGIYDAMNKGIALATGDVIGILNADDRYYDNLVLNDVAQVFDDPEVDACYGDGVYVDMQDRVVRYWKSGPYRPAKFYLGWMPLHPTCFIRKCVYDRCGTFDRKYSIAGDYELLLRLILIHKISMKCIDRLLVRITIGGHSNKSVLNRIKGNIEVFQAWRRSNVPFGYFGYFVPFLKPSQKIFQFVQRPDEKGQIQVVPKN